MWSMYMRPDINTAEFTEDENKTIHLAVKNDSFQWYEIAKSLNNRSALQCITQYWHVVVLKRYDQPTKTFKWTEEQDNFLIDLVKKYTIGVNIQWVKVSSHFPNLETNRLLSRYLYNCRPGLSKGAFTLEEDIKLMAGIETFGEDFDRIAKNLLPGRSVVQLRFHYCNHLKDSIERDHWSPENDAKLMAYVELYKHDWVKISNLFNKRFTRISCRSRYCIISNHLAKSPSNTVQSVPTRKRHATQKVNLDNWKSKFCEILNLPKENKKSSSKKRKVNPCYVDKLRALEKCFYEYFKYSYDYYFGNDFNSLAENTRLLYLCKALEFEEIVSETHLSQKLPNMIIKNLLLKQCNNNLVVYESDTLPPCWENLLGLRSILIFKSTLAKELDSTCKKEAEIHKIDNELEHYKLLFKRRFRTVFFKSSLLSLIHSSEFKSLFSIAIV